MLSISELLVEVESGLSKMNLVTHPENLYTPIEYTMSLGGKRIRPVMCLAACQIFSGSYVSALDAGLGIELFHNFTLLHDDVMDGALVRRNHQTVHVKWNANTAILSGDAMMIKALQYVARTESPRFRQVLDVFNQTALEVCEGQQYDMEFESRLDVTEQEYLEMIRLKTAVLLAGSMKIGALIGGAEASDADRIYSFAENVGMAFQLQDDLLDVYGDEKTFGKAIGGDIASNKKTFMLISALEKANGVQKNELNRWINLATFDRDEKVDAITTLYNELKIKELAQARINEYFDAAIHDVNELNISNEGRNILHDFVKGLIHRNR